jgi:hypothetical protein
MTFDSAQFLQGSVDGAMDTKILPVPDGEYAAIIEKIDARTWTSKDGLKSGVTLDVTWEISDEGLRQELKRQKITVRQGIMLDLDDAGKLDTSRGKNIGLGRLREALNKNVPGQPFSFNELPGCSAKIKVTQRVDGEDIYNDVKGVTTL